MHRKSKILVVDDEPNNLTLIRVLLSSDYEVSLVPSGRKALDILDKVQPDLILLDIMMPEMNGYEVCRRIKNRHEMQDIPIIFVTAMSEIEDEEKGFELGAVDYITKPIKPSIFKARVKAHLALQREKILLKENIRLRGDVERITRHDLKSPLNGIINYPLIIKSGENISEKQQGQLDKIVQLGRKMLNMINLSLDLYKMEHDTYEVKLEEVDLMMVFNEIVDESKIRLKTKQLTINRVINGRPVDESTQFFMNSEKLLVYSMLSNLFKNAVEASPIKEVITFAMTHGESLSFSIHNQGSVPVQIRDRFFEKYATAGKSGGTGLGTYSARLIAETLGGQISLETSDENGTTVQVSFSQSKQLFQNNH